MPNVFDQVCKKNGWAVIDGAAIVPLPGDRQQSLYQGMSNDGGEEVLCVHTIVGGADELTEVQLRAALGINSRLLYGAFSIMDDRLVLADTFLLSHATEHEVDRSACYLAKTADQYERLIYKTDAN